jgi:hypothetical protein
VVVLLGMVCSIQEIERGKFGLKIEKGEAG